MTPNHAVSRTQHPSGGPSLLAHARTLTPAPLSVLMMRPFQECPQDRRCGISRRGGRALRRRTVVLRRDCSWLTCGAEAEGDRLGDLEETWRSRLGSDLAANFGQRAFSRAYRAYCDAARLSQKHIRCTDRAGHHHYRLGRKGRHLGTRVLKCFVRKSDCS